MGVRPDELDQSIYQNPLIERYASRRMAEHFSADHRYRIWRDLWIALAQTQAELGLPIQPRQIEELRSVKDVIPYARVRELESELRHDVMAHIHAFAEQAPGARGILHLGATSCFVTDNADLILMKGALGLIAEGLADLLRGWRVFALEHRSLPTLGYTHFQPAQPTTVGKRAALWAQDFLSDYLEVERLRDGLRFRGAKGATGTQAGFLGLFDGDERKVRELDARLAARMGFPATYCVTGQTYPRKLDAQVLQAIGGIGLSAHKVTNDLRMLQGLGDMEEPFGASQVGSSAMPYKRNPVRLERMSSIAKLLLCEVQNACWVAATQWFERTLDDSANRRVSIPQAFLAADAVLALANHVVRGLAVYPAVIRLRLERELPFIAMESILLAASKAGGDRQALHERLRVHSMTVAEARRRGEEGLDLLTLVRGDPAFAMLEGELETLLDPARYCGRAPQQVEEFFHAEVDPVLARQPEASGTWEVSI